MHAGCSSLGRSDVFRPNQVARHTFEGWEQVVPATLRRELVHLLPWADGPDLGCCGREKVDGPIRRSQNP